MAAAAGSAGRDGPEAAAIADKSADGKTAATAGRKRGRPPKAVAAGVEQKGQDAASRGGNSDHPKTAARAGKKPRGRPPKAAAGCGAVPAAERPKKGTSKQKAAAASVASAPEQPGSSPGSPGGKLQLVLSVSPAAAGTPGSPAKQPRSDAAAMTGPAPTNKAATGAGTPAKAPGSKAGGAKGSKKGSPKGAKSGRPSFLEGLPHMQEAVAGGDTPASSAGSGGSGRRGMPLDGDYPRCVNRVRNNIYTMRREMGAIEALQAEGWRGASRDAVKMTAELERAQRQVEKCKLLIREAIKVCEDVDGTAAIPQSAYDADGCLAVSHIFCAICNGKDSLPGNDIVLCDGPCDRAYHEQCLQPPLDASTLPEDQPWLCPACTAKDQALELLNSWFGFQYELDTPWHAVFAEAAAPEGDAAPAAAAHPAAEATAAAAAHRDGGSVRLMDAELPSDDEEDSDFGGSHRSDAGAASADDAASSGAEDSADGDAKRARPSTRQTRGGGGGGGAAAGPDAGAGSDHGKPHRRRRRRRQRQQQLGGRKRLRSGGGGGSGGGAAAAHPGAEPSGSGSDDEDGSSLASEAPPGPDGTIEDVPVGPEEGPAAAAAAMASAAADATRRRSGSSATTDPALLVLPGKRARKAVDYQKLNAEMFGDYEAFEGEADVGEEEWGPDSVTPRFGGGRGRGGRFR